MSSQQTLVVATGLSIALGGKTLFDDFSFHIETGDRIALLGPNGSGKSTLFRLLAGELPPDSGTLQWTQGVRVGYLSQSLPEGRAQPLIEYVMAGVPGRKQVHAELEAVQETLDRLSQPPPGGETEAQSEARLATLMEAATSLAELEETRTLLETLYSEHRAEEILTGLGFHVDDMQRSLDAFSGGWRMRAYFASLLLQSPDLLLLDEPTNHLDMPSVAWFSNFLKRYKGAFVVISHDPEFLQEQTERVISYEPEGVRLYQGKLYTYREHREIERLHLIERAKNLEKERKHHEEFIDRFRAKASKASAVQSRVKLLEKMEQPVQLQSRRTLRFRFPESEPSHRQVLSAEGLVKRYDGRTILDKVKVRIDRDDRICIAGVNGAGKSTLLRMLAGIESADEGVVELGNKVRLGYFAQEHLQTLDPNASALDEVKRAGPSCNETQVRGALGVLGFDTEAMDKVVHVLSGGERARVALACLLVQRANFLVLDEPTNHLDLESTESLADALSRFDGPLLFVSHNRGFARTLAKQIWHVEGAQVQEFVGTFDAYLERFTGNERMDEAASQRIASENGVGGAAAGPTGTKVRDKVPAPLKNEQPKEPGNAAAAPNAASGSEGNAHANQRQGTAPSLSSNASLSAKELHAARNHQRQLKKALRPLESRAKQLEEQIEVLEGEQEKRNAELSDPANHSDPKERDRLLWSFQTKATELAELMEEWSALQERIDALRVQIEPS